MEAIVTNRVEGRAVQAERVAGDVGDGFDFDLGDSGALRWVVCVQQGVGELMDEGLQGLGFRDIGANRDLLPKEVAVPVDA